MLSFNSILIISFHSQYPTNEMYATNELYPTDATIAFSTPVWIHEKSLTNMIIELAFDQQTETKT